MKAHRFSLLLPLVLASCQSTHKPSAYDAPEVAQPPISSFFCDNGHKLIVRNYVSSVNIVRDDGSTLDLPAVEPGSKSRYSKEQTAIVFDGPTALFMITGKPPANCKR